MGGQANEHKLSLGNKAKNAFTPFKTNQWTSKSKTSGWPGLWKILGYDGEKG